MVHTTHNKASLPYNCQLGKLRLMTDNDKDEFEAAADHTAEQLSEGWYEFTQSNASSANNKSQVCNAMSHNLKQWKNSDQNTEMVNAGLDSSILSPFPMEAENNLSGTNRDLSPTDPVTLDPYSEKYFHKLVKALGLDTDDCAHLTPDIVDKFKQLLRRYPTAFYLPGSQLSMIKEFQHNITTNNDTPIYKLPYRKSHSELAAIKEELHRMLKLHIIQPSTSEWASSCILVRKPPIKGVLQTPRFVVDYRNLNSVTVGDGYPIPSVDNILDVICNGKYYGKWDLASGYWQVSLNPHDRAKTAFSTHLGLYEFLRLPFGLKTAPKTFQRILNTVFCELIYKWLVIYIDDCLIWVDTQQEALHHYELILKRAVEFGIQFKPTKCCFFATELDVLGHRVTQEGHFPTEKGVEAIRNFPHPQNATAVKKFLGMCGFFHSYIPNFSNWSLHLRSLLLKDTKFGWTSAHESEFSHLKASLTSDDLILLHPNWNQEFELHTDASKFGCGAMLAQYY